ncbi:PmbA [candidate division LCP-89 bacterium B3_LCP]|uniref:PmbA n=1 Tax=candidate division LCP-89 bacterium B3_LCP TaxID=2012998 RepID=A0A532V107_UNCL8|nr:MAG: PmbA [candidate division LCP-89 bacterium B3_LCP]
MTIQEAAKYTVERAMKSGADQADVYLESGRESTVTVRMGELETLKQATSKGLGLRVFTGNRLGFAYTSDFSKKSLKAFAKRTVEMAEEITSDPHNVLPDSTKKDAYPDLGLYDSKIAEIPIDWKIKTAKKMEETTFAYDKRIVNSSGASVYDGELEAVIANSLGIFHTYKTSSCTLVCSPIAEENGKKESNYWYTSKRFFEDLESAEEVAEKAAFRAIRMLNPTKPKTQVVPVVFDPQMAASFIGIIFYALNGESILKRSSFMVDKLNEKVASGKFTMIDDPLMKRGIGSQPIDDEGVPTNTKTVIDAGKLKYYFYNAYSAHKAGKKPTGNARRGYSSTPSVGAWNLYLKAGEMAPEEIIKSVDNGLYLTRTMGWGVNMVNGDISRGASGLWIENGELTHSIGEATIAGNLLGMLKNVSMVGNDLEFRSSRAAPTIKIDDVTVSGT